MLPRRLMRQRPHAEADKRRRGRWQPIKPGVTTESVEAGCDHSQQRFDQRPIGICMFSPPLPGFKTELDSVAVTTLDGRIRAVSRSPGMPSGRARPITDLLEFHQRVGV